MIACVRENYLMFTLAVATLLPFLKAYAYINHYLSVYNDRWCESVSGQMHEIGHNLGLAHSGEGSNNYADQRYVTKLVSCHLRYTYSKTHSLLFFITVD